MNKNTPVERMEQILTEQTAAVERIYALQKDMYKSVMERDWLACEKQLSSLNSLSQKFSELDKKLFDLIEDFNHGDFLIGGQLDFFTFTNTLQKDDKKKLECLYKTLQSKIASSKIENEVFSNYIAHAQSLVQGIVDIISEERGGKCYTRTGKKVNADMTSLVLNETL